ncbi:Adenine DNA glycosylase domain-containing protein, MutY-like [Desulfonema magnum]|uniref:Adenine DNA glycosylase n=1 Tax=Desulfonema magnum TaxID=45655 RepID=A0A975GMN6_9BACT|nr:Adenine DNA glycosylase domain-containing protein, MutY-like [Desulfonema magnum]
MKIKNIPHIQEHLVHWYMKNQRQLPWRETHDPYHVWVSEVMLQQTQVKTVLPYYEKFLRHFPDITSLAQADLQAVLKLWEGLGYYARARNFHRAANVVVKEYNSKIPDDPGEFQKLPGVGDYIASAVQSIAFGHPCAAADGNVKRVLARLFQIDAPVNKSASHKLFKSTADKLLASDMPGTFNQAIMELGAMICKPKHPMCDICPLPSFCLAHQARKTDEYPRRTPGKPVPEYHIAAGVVYKEGQVLITRRKPEGLLGGLWEFPGGKVRKNEDAKQACIREIKEETNLVVEVESHLTCVRHAYTHFKIVMDVFRCAYVSGRVKLNGPEDFRWIATEETEQYPFPKANLKFIPLLKN